MSTKLREQVYNKYNGRCAYSGTPLEDDWQVDHFMPIRHCGKSDIDNLLPAQKIINHYKRALTLEQFRTLRLGGLHKRLAKLPRNPRTEKGKNRKSYILKVASYFGITPDTPFDGVFYFEKAGKEC